MSEETMSDSYEQVQLRQHMAELRRAAHGLGHDFAIEFKNAGEKIDRLGSLTAKEAKYFKEDIEEDLGAMRRRIDAELRALPGRIANAGGAIEDATVRAAGAVGDAVYSAGHRARQGTKNALAVAAGVKRTPMKEWHVPSEESSSSD